jgi:gamma-glutamyltranspeptidase/glutathione hydrolase
MSSRLSRPGQWPGRSTVLAARGMVSAGHPLAAAVGIDILRQGGNAVDAAIAASATLAAVEPLSIGIGGDLFALVWIAREKRLACLNASGGCPAKLSWRTFARKGLKAVPNFGWASITVPGCVDGWWKLHQAAGCAPWKNLFAAASDYAREGVPLSEVASLDFENVEPRLQNDAARAIFNPGGRAPEYGERFTQTDLAQSLRVIAEGGRDAFYRGELADTMLAASDAEGGFFARDDFAHYAARWEQPATTRFRDIDVATVPPNSQGFSALLALNILASLDLEKLKDDWGALTHATLEALKLACAERDAHTADPDTYAVRLNELLSLTFATHIGATIDPARAIARPQSVLHAMDGDTAAVCAADASGNVVSLMGSLFHGSGIVAPGTGIHFHNRGAGFSLDGASPNLMEPGKRPFHTLMPVLALRDGRPYLALGVTGGHHQPQGCVQILLNFLLHGMTLQEAVAAPRLDFRTENFFALEADFPSELRELLASKGHQIVANDGGPFGGAQAVRIMPNGVLEGASDPRKDGCALGY